MKHASVILLLGLVVLLPAQEPAKFRMPIDEIVILQSSGKVFAIGVIADGTVGPGSKLAVRTKEKDFLVSVIGINAPGLPARPVRAGDRVHLLLDGVTKEQVHKGDVVVSRKGD